MAKHSDQASRTHDALHEMLGVYHEKLHEIAKVEHKCRLQRAVLKATAMSEMSQSARNLQVSNEAINHLAVLCW
ncbi:MAG TPA: hypothetical protein VGM86_32615 [Thermoanaerobaculia bacterium]|jgi:hypothetical protein